MSFQILMSYNCADISSMFSHYQIFKYTTNELTKTERRIFIKKLNSCGIFLKDIPRLFTKPGRPKS